MWQLIIGAIGTGLSYFFKPLILSVFTIFGFLFKGAGIAWIVHNVLLYLVPMRLPLTILSVFLTVWLANQFIPLLIQTYGVNVFADFLTYMASSKYGYMFYSALYLLKKIGFFDYLTLYLSCVIYTSIARMAIRRLGNTSPL